jgi:DNA-binding CsgD family transcriptional regulator
MENYLESPSCAATLVDLLPVGTMLSRGRIIINSNNLFAGMFGYRREEVIGKSIELLYPSFREYVDRGDKWQGFLRHTGEHCDERIMLCKGENPVWARVKGRCQDRHDPYELIACTFELVAPATDPAKISLTARESAIVDAMREGMTSKEIARALNLSPRTVETYRARLMAKTGASNGAHLLSLLA